MISDDMQGYLPFEPVPPPVEDEGGVYGHWSADPAWGPPAWPPQVHESGGSHPVRRVLIAGLAVVSIGFGGGVTAWALSGRSTHPGSTATTITPGSQSSASTGADGSASGTAGSGGSVIAGVDAALVDINATLGSGEVAGTGMVITASGQVLTNNHVIEGTTNIRVQIDGAGPVYNATVVGDDPADDIALLQISGVSGLKTISIGNSDAVTVGEQITAIGNALGRGGTPAAVSGVVSALGQVVTAADETGTSETLTGMIQVDASIQPGDSGGAVIDASGHVLGITTAGSQSGRFGQDSASTTGFAIPISKAMSIVREIRSGGGTGIHIGSGALLGVVIASGGTSGASVDAVKPGTPAEQAGIGGGDTIIQIGGIAVRSSSDLRSAMQRFSPGQSVTVVWLDGSGAQHSARVQLIAGPPA